MPTRVTTDDVIRLRLANQRLHASKLRSPAEVARHLLATQAQDFGAACWALGLRAPGTSRLDVLAALERREIVRSWPMRGTLHFVPPEDLGWMLGVTTRRMVTGLATRHRQLELETSTLERAKEVVIDALSGGRTIGRSELMQVFEAHGIGTTGQRGYHLIYFLAQTGTVCWGPPYKSQQSLVLLDEWVTSPRTLGPEEALREFLVRYFDGHGPATLKDFAWWSKVTITDTRAALALARNDLVELDLDGTSYWMTAKAADATSAASGARDAGETVLALPAFDEYLLGYQDRSLVLPPRYAQRIVPGGNGIFFPTIVSRGRVVGTWRRAAARGVTAEPQAFTRLTARESAGFERAIGEYARFVGPPGHAA
ncbi:MAG: hypothetical protein QOF36_1896 [Microbacteriaceae bacterium]|jgi:hypothetical protein|nr:hypothetical protein [Microbacteriaceae bacterium]